MILNYILMHKSKDRKNPNIRYYYATSKSLGDVTLANIVTEISNHLCMKRTTVNSIIKTCFELMAVEMSEGKTVHFGNLGNFRFSDMNDKTSLLFIPEGDFGKMLETVNYVKLNRAQHLENICESIFKSAIPIEK